MAFIMNVLLRMVEEKLFAPLNQKNYVWWNRSRRVVCVILTIGLLIGLIFILLFMIVPEIARTGRMIAAQLPGLSLIHISPYDYRLAENIATAQHIHLAEYLGARLHMCHVSTEEAMGEVIRAKIATAPVTAVYKRQLQDLSFGTNLV